ncbi:MAG: hypothetical protein A2166_03465 [Omnitrophica WOR_2 bacterium RBG_13_41_10]|nr:MAG: hypothetical protein A2166_03465 [Omnitrophica WOR_2 bacterium RBG_13_41_10]
MRKIYYIIALLLVIFGLFSVYIYIPKEDNFAKGADEGHYLAYSKYLSENGITNYPKIFKEHVEIEKNRIWPSPLRFGYFLLSSLWLKIFGPTFRSLANLSFICYVFLLLFSLYFSNRYFGKEIASLFVLLLAFSPLAMAMAKRALSDSMGNMFIAISIWLFLSFLTEKKIFNFILFIVFYAFSILIREQYILFICFFSLYFLIYKYIYKVNIPTIYFPAIILLPLFIVGLIWVISSGSLANLIYMIKLTRVLPTINEYSVLFCRGPWFRYMIDYILISPLVTILALSFIIYVLANRSFLKDYKISYFLILFFVLYILLSIFDYNKNVRYAINLDMIMRLFAVFMLKEIFKKSKFMSDFVFMAILFLCLTDYLNFTYLFCQKNIYDPVSFVLLKVRQFIP